MSRLLLVEDDHSLAESLRDRLEQEKYQVVWVDNILKAKKILPKENFDLVILDITLPDGSGFDLAREFRQTISTPFLFLTAQNTPEDRVLGYEIGAEEYIPKPFHLRELLMRVEHVLKNHTKARELVFEDITVNFSTLQIQRGLNFEALTVKEAAVLKILIEKSPQVLSRDEILNFCWGHEEFPSNRTVDNIIVRLRQLLGDKLGAKIQSVREVGYQWLK